MRFDEEAKTWDKKQDRKVQAFCKKIIQSYQVKWL